MTAIGEKGGQFPFIENRLDHLHIHQMRSTQVGIVYDVDVARLDVLNRLNHRAGGKFHNVDETRQPARSPA